MFETIQNIIADRMDIDAETITKDSTFADLSIDSLDMVEITMDLEEAFSITIDPKTPMENVAELIAYIEKAKG